MDWNVMVLLAAQSACWFYVGWTVRTLKYEKAK